MKQLALCWVVSMACPALSFAQVTPMFEMPVYFEDALGNRDTLVIGYDVNASYNSLNPQFDGPKITEPFDSVFEVRAIHGDDSDFNGFEMSKRLIGYYETSSGIPCGISEGTKIVVSSEYPPITISYDSTRLTHLDSCRANTILSRDWMIFYFQYWWDAEYWTCMGNTSRIVDDLVPHLSNGLWSLSVEAEVEGQGMQELPAFFIQFRDWGPCTDSTILSTSLPLKDNKLRLYPNPQAFGDEVFLERDIPVSGGDVQVVTATGIPVRQMKWPQGQQRLGLSTAGLSPGLYMVTVLDGQGRRVASAKLALY